MTMLPVEAVEHYARDVRKKLATGHAAEHAYRAALQALVEELANVEAVNDPKRSEHGAPDFVFLQRDATTLIRGWAEAKDINVNLDKAELTEQLQRYAGYPNLFLTNYIDFRFFENGRLYDTQEIAGLKGGTLTLRPDQYEALADALSGFLAKPPESIESGRRLAEVMGAKARRIRHNVERYLSTDSEKNDELLRIFELIRTLLVHDLDHARFADMYSQTLVYGLFAARYNDPTPESFSRAEARDLIPASNPFLREFFDHIAGSKFDRRLAFIVDELCDVFAVSSVTEIVHKDLGSSSDESDVRDPIIHFYEDFLEAYDPALRKKMGVYYTPLPVVRFMVRTVDAILKRDFSLPDGLADTSKAVTKVSRQGKPVALNLHKIQILDPAVGTATFLNEIIKYVHGQFDGQQGRWPAYATQDLIPRLHGFELLMAPYTVSHLKLGLTLQESGVANFGQRLGVYLTNALEAGATVPQDLFHFGLAEAVAQEALQASEIKTERPIMVVIGNPPYSGESSNKTDFATDLVASYKVEPGGMQRLRERNPKWINDDYVKFIAFSEAMVNKNGEGIVAMITNHGYLDNPTFRGMRWRLSQTFDSIYVLNLHGNSKKKEVTPDGGKDENVFPIQQGVAIMFAVLTGRKKRGQDAQVLCADVWGRQSEKFETLNADAVDWVPIALDKETYDFVDRPEAGREDYAAGVSLDELFLVSNVGVVTSADAVLIGDDVRDLERRIRGAVVDETSGKVGDRLRRAEVDMDNARSISYRPLDDRVVYYDPLVLERAREDVMQHFVKGENLGLVAARMMKENNPGVFITKNIIGHKLFSAYDINSVFPLYLWHDDGSRTSNFAQPRLRQLLAKVSVAREPDEVLDYIYGALHSPAYREKYKNLLKRNYPRVPIPSGDVEFERLAKLGERLRRLHVETDTATGHLTTTYPIPGSDQVVKTRYDDSRVWINKGQYFGNVPEIAWNFYVGGYQPAQKWLKDRKGKTLSSADIVHYQRIIAALNKTDEIMREIDA